MAVDRERGRRVRALAILVAVLMLLAWGAYVAISLLTARTELATARGLSMDGRSALLAGEPAAARDDLATATATFTSAERRLKALPMLPLRAIPVVRANVRAASALAAAGAHTAAAGKEVTGALAELPGGLKAMTPRAGTIPLAPLDVIAPALRRAGQLLEEARRSIAEAPDRRLIDPVADARAELLSVVDEASEMASAASTVTEVLPAFLGADRPKRYFFGASNPAELRGTGGLIGAYAILTVDAGHIDIGPFGPVQDLPTVPAEDAPAPSPDYADRYDRYGGAGFWLNINMTPDFPSAAQAIEGLYEQVTGERLDGAIAADPFTLAALLELTGPAAVPGAGTTVDADTVVAYLANEAYAVITDAEERKRLLGAVAASALDAFLRGDGGGLAEALPALGAAARGGHLLLHSREDDVQRALDELDVSGRMPDVEGDFLATVVNNAANNKGDFYTERTVHYQVALGDGGGATATAAVELVNETPTTGLPAYVIGPNISDAAPGDNRSLLSVYCSTSCQRTGFRRSSGDTPLREEHELGYPVFTTMVVLASGETERVELDWTVDDAWEAGRDRSGVYRLTVHDQPTIRPTRLVVDVTVPNGTAVVAASEGFLVEDGTARWEGDVRPTTALEVVFAPPHPTDAGSAWERIRGFLERPVFGQGSGGA